MGLVRYQVPQDLKIVLIDRDQGQVDASKRRLEYWYKEIPGQEVQRYKVREFDVVPDLPAAESYAEELTRRKLSAPPEDEGGPSATPSPAAVRMSQ